MTPEHANQFDFIAAELQRVKSLQNHIDQLEKDQEMVHQEVQEKANRNVNLNQ